MSKPKTITVTRTSTITFDVAATSKQHQYDGGEPDYKNVLALIVDGAIDFFSEYSGGEITYTDEHNNVLTMEA
jgi:hypothetical protein